MGKLAVVTGAASGIGRELAKLAAEKGYDLVVVDKDEEGLNGLKEEILKDSSDHKVEILAMDLASPEAVEVIRESVIQIGKPVALLINCAGFGVFGRFTETTLEKELEMIRLHVELPVSLSKVFLPGMLAAREGRILNVASLAGFVPGPMMSVYYASKAFLINFTRAMDSELSGTKVKVSVLCPGVTRTRFSGTVHGTTATIAKDGFLSLSADLVARRAFRMLWKGKPVIIPGRINRIIYLFQRILPQSWLAKAVYRSQIRIRKSVA